MNVVFAAAAALTADGSTRLKVLYLADYARIYHPDCAMSKHELAILRSIFVQCRMDTLQYDMLYGEYGQIGLRRLVLLVQKLAGRDKVLSWVLTHAGTVETLAFLVNKETRQLEEWTCPNVSKCILVTQNARRSEGFSVVGADTPTGGEMLRHHHLGKQWPVSGYAERFVEVLTEEVHALGLQPVVLHIVSRHQTAANTAQTLAHSATIVNHLKMYHWYVIEVSFSFV